MSPFFGRARPQGSFFRSRPERCKTFVVSYRRVALQDSARCPTGEKGGSFIVDLVLKDFSMSVLPITSLPPPTHFHLIEKQQQQHNSTSGLFSYFSSVM